MSNSSEPFFSTRAQKFVLNIVLILAILSIEIGCVYLILKLQPETFYVKAGVLKKYGEYRTLNPEVFTFVSLSLIIAWIGILIGYYAWAIYYYNINLGKTNEEWAEAKKKKLLDANMKNIDPEMAIDTDAPQENPYKDETFGLPNGTVRGTIALSMLVGGFALLIQGQNLVFFVDENAANALEKYLEYYKNAFIMMIAFYFGSQSLKFLQKSPAPAPATGNTSGNVPVAPANLKETVSTVPGAVLVKRDAVTVYPLKPVTAGTEPPKSAIAPEPSKTIEQAQAQQKISKDDIATCAMENNLEAALIQATMAVESNGNGFLADGRPVILFEGHIFWKQLEGIGKKPEDFAAANPDILYPVWTTKYYSKVSANEYLRLERAITIDKDSALKSCSWGLFQIMGFNYSKAGYNTVSEFVADQKISEYKQLSSFISFIKNEKMLDDLKAHNWKGFAKAYNGRDYEKNNYDVKLEDAYYKFVHEQNPVVKAAVKRAIQNEKETLGELVINNAGRTIFACKTLELPWKGNEKDVSCIPTGTYEVKKRSNETHGNHFELLNVPGRSYILIHSGNYFSETRGCILPGKDHVDINGDGLTDVNLSKETMTKLNELLPVQFEMTIS